MRARMMVALVLVSVFVPSVLGQVPPPKHESRLHHLFASHRDADNLRSRFEMLKCALVLIESGQKVGTGFYISRDGDLATASHVLGDRMFFRDPDNQMQIKVNLAVPSVLYLTDSKGRRAQISARLIENNPDAWLSDVAR